MSKDNKEVAKRIADEAFEIRRELQYQAMLDWDAGLMTGTEAIEKITNEERVIYIREKFQFYRDQVALMKKRRANSRKK